jgi:raffinose/stachyose/melibiose transport system permease protein
VTAVLEKSRTGSTPARRRRRRGLSSQDTTWTRYVQPVVVIVFCVVVVGIPLWLALITSAKSQGEANLPDLTLPSHWHLLDNYATAFTQGQVWRGFFGSVLVMVPAVIGVILFGSIASWILARRASRLAAVLYAAAISGVILPPAVVTLVLLLRQLHLASTATGMIFVYMGMYMSIVIFFITGFVRTIPVELEEAARIDGASPMRVFFSIIFFPLLRPVIATATILVCLYIWNDVFYSFFVLGGGSTTTLQLNLFQVASSNLYQNNWNLIFAYVVISSLPLLIVFIFAQRRIISGITGGAVK